MSLLNQLKNKLSLKAPSPVEQPHTRQNVSAEILLNRLAGIIKTDLDVLTRDAELTDRGIQQIRLLSGCFEDDDEKKSYYLFLQIPDAPGFLFDTTETPLELRLQRATQAAPLMADFSGAPVRPTIFVMQGKPIEFFTILEVDCVRSQLIPKTYSLERLSEYLITSAFDALT